MRKRTVRDVMTWAPTAVRPWTPFKDLARLLRVEKISALPVIDDERRPVGVVSEADLLDKRGSRDRGSKKPHATVAHELMTTPPITIEMDATIPEAAREMRRRHLKRLPVVGRDGRLVGIVSRSDLLRVFLRSDEEIAREIESDVVRDALWIEAGVVDVRVENGVVTLTGTVERKSIIPIMVGLVAGVDGVVDVRDHLAASIDDTRVRPEPTLPEGVLPKGLRYP